MIPTEEQEQIEVVKYLTSKGHKHTAIPNSTFTKSWKQKAKNTRMGLHAGLPDLVAIVDNILIFIEMKRTKNSVTSPQQKEWIKALQEAGVPVKVCKGAKDAIKFIKEYEIE